MSPQTPTHPPNHRGMWRRLVSRAHPDAGGDPWTIPKAVEALGCRVEELPEFDNRRFVFPPAERVA